MKPGTFHSLDSKSEHRELKAKIGIIKKKSVKHLWLLPGTLQKMCLLVLLACELNLGHDSLDPYYLCLAGVDG